MTGASPVEWSVACRIQTSAQGSGSSRPNVTGLRLRRRGTAVRRRAQAWRGRFGDDYVRNQVVSDPHSPRQFRVNGVVRNLDAWYSAFGVGPEQKLYVAPGERVRIW